MKQFLALLLALAMVLTLTACKSKKKKNDQTSDGFDFMGGQSTQEATNPQDVTEAPTGMATPEVTAPPEPETEPTESHATEPEPVETEPPETEPPTTAPLIEDDALWAVYQNEMTFWADSGREMYLWEYADRNGATKVTKWSYIDLDDDGGNEMLLQLDSKSLGYIVLYWDGEEVLGYGFGFRDISEVKTNGLISGSAGAAHMIFYKLEFRNGGCRTKILAEFDFDSGYYVINGSRVSEARAMEYLDEWSYLPSHTGATDIYTEVMPSCAWCGRVTNDLVTQLCDDCYWYVGWCSWCGQLSTEIYDGVCTDCRPYEGYDRYCDACGADCMGEEMIDGLCLDCWYYYYG